MPPYCIDVGNPPVQANAARGTPQVNCRLAVMIMSLLWQNPIGNRLCYLAINLHFQIVIRADCPFASLVQFFFLHIIVGAAFSIRFLYVAEPCGSSVVSHPNNGRATATTENLS